MDSEPVGGTYIVVEQYDGSIDEGLVLNSGDTVEVMLSLHAPTTTPHTFIHIGK